MLKLLTKIWNSRSLWKVQPGILHHALVLWWHTDWFRRSLDSRGWRPTFFTSSLLQRESIFYLIHQPVDDTLFFHFRHFRLLFFRIRARLLQLLLLFLLLSFDPFLFLNAKLLVFLLSIQNSITTSVCFEIASKQANPFVNTGSIALQLMWTCSLCLQNWYSRTNILGTHLPIPGEWKFELAELACSSWF